jgi:hypothetical protein
MDITCVKGDWDVVLSEDGDSNLEGVLVFHTRKYLGFRLILMPPQTAYSGIHIIYREKVKSHTINSFENNVTLKLLSLLPTNDLYYLQYGTQFTNGLSHVWEKYSSTIRYTYLLHLKDKSEEQLWNQLKTKRRNSIRKVKPLMRFQNIDFSAYWANCETTFKVKKQPNPYNEEILRKLYDHFHPIGKCHITACINIESNEISAATFLIEDNQTTYYLSGFSRPHKNESGALSLLLWENIKTCHTEIFDFEGSMIKPIEQFFRSFGGELTPHFKVWKVNNPLLRFILKFKKLPFLDW